VTSHVNNAFAEGEPVLAARRSLLDLDRLINAATATVRGYSARNHLWPDRIDTDQQRGDFGTRALRFDLAGDVSDKITH
jgi:hypothetical protein